ncbi:MAG: potassium channel family protein [Muribaculaceae bacterium]|nr:potassium channel family protein [Muribaculaceae bacterium]
MKEKMNALRIKKDFQEAVHALVMVLSVLLIVYISYDTFMNIPFLSNHHYMVFQFWVCIVFLADFFIELVLAEDKKKYLKNRWFFLLISIPYLNIINQYQITLSHEVIFYLRFVPLLRGAYSLSMVMGYISKNRAVSLLSQYLAILVALVYILALIFYYEEYTVNPDVHSFWDALYWSSLYVTTVGASFSAVTPVGKIISVILPIAGMLILPLFTVYFTDMVRSRNNANDAATAGVDKKQSESNDD